MKTTTHRFSRSAAALSCVALAALASTSCGNDSKTSSGSSTSTAAASQGSLSTATHASKPLVRTIGKTGWWDGFSITVDKATLTPSSGGGGSLTVDLTYKNLTDQNVSPSPNGFLQVGNEVVAADFDDPTVPGNGTATGKATATLTSESTDLATLLDSVVLNYGKASDNQTKIPLSASGKVDSVEPKTLTVTGRLVQDQIDIDVVRGTLAPSYKSGEKDKMTLDLKIKISCGPNCSQYGYNTGQDEFSVTAPDGASVVADSRSPYCCDALYPGDVSDNEKNVLVFLVPAPGLGKYELKYENKKLTEAGSPPATLAFTI